MSLEFAWDLWGNLTLYWGHTCEWDDADRLVEFDRSGSTEYDAEYAYLPGTWKRYKRILGGDTEYYLYDGDNVLASYDDNGTLNARYLSPGLDENLSMTRGQDTYYYMADGLGSVRNLLDADETVLNTYDYYAFGDELSATEGVVSSYRFTAREAEPGGLSQAHFYRNRYYMPQAGIFMSRDAMWADAHRGWGYVANRPTMFIDPHGLFGKGKRDGGAYLGHSDFCGSDRFDYNLEDTDPNTGPVWHSWRHFRDLDDVEEDMKTAVESGDKDAFQRHAHQGQDYFAHRQGLGYGQKGTAGRAKWRHLLGYTPFWTNPDDTRIGSPYFFWQQADKWTRQWVQEWDKRWGYPAGGVEVGPGLRMVMP